jgi:hypothetical protein
MVYDSDGLDRFQLEVSDERGVGTVLERAVEAVVVRTNEKRDLHGVLVGLVRTMALGKKRDDGSLLLYKQ